MAKKFLTIDTEGNKYEADASGEDIQVVDTGDYFTGTDLETILQEIGDKLSTVVDDGNEYTAGEDITKGDLVYISANDTISVYSDITQFQVGIGIALETVTTGNPVRVLRNDTVIDGFTGLVAGTKYYWNGTSATANYSSFGTGDYIYVLGVAKNATSVHVEVMFLAKKG